MAAQMQAAMLLFHTILSRLGVSNLSSVVRLLPAALTCTYYAQNSTSSVLLRCLHIAADETHGQNTGSINDGSRGANGTFPSPGALPQAVRSNLARLAGSLRRLGIKEEADFDEDEYLEAAAAVRMTAIKCAGQTRCVHMLFTRAALWAAAYLSLAGPKAHLVVSDALLQLGLLVPVHGGLHCGQSACTLCML